MYADYSYYTSSQYCGKMSESDYDVYGERATDFIASVTFDRVTDAILSDETTGRAVKMCCCAVADKLQKQAARDGKTSEKVGSYSVSYEQSADGEKQCYGTVSMYLSRHGLMYRGCD